MSASRLTAVALSIAVLASCEEGSVGVWGYDPTKQRMLAEPFTCPAGTEAGSRSLGMGGGYVHYCFRRSAGAGAHEVEHGPLTFWHDGWMWSRGQKVDGRSHGTWTWFREDGTIRMIQEWDHGKMLSETTYDASGVVVTPPAQPTVHP